MLTLSPHFFLDWRYSVQYYVEGGSPFFPSPNPYGVRSTGHAPPTVGAQNLTLKTGFARVCRLLHSMAWSDVNCCVLPLKHAVTFAECLLDVVHTL